MTYEQALEQVRHAIYGKDVREAIAYLFANTKDVDPSLKQNSTNAIQNGAVWKEFQKAYQKIEKVGAATKVDQSLSRYSENAIQNKSVWAEFQNAYLKIAQLGTTGVAGTVTIGLEDAAGDGITDDTDALNKALNHSNCVIDGGNRRYKYLSIVMENVENVLIQNVTFWKGQEMVVKGCKNIRFENCRWEGINPNGTNTVWTCGLKLMQREDANGNKIWCENITIEGCVFYDIWYNENVQGSYSHHVSGIGLVPFSVHNLFVRHCIFSQIHGNAAIHWNTWEKTGYFEITDNLFYLTCWGSVCLFRFEAAFPKMRCKVSSNHFIGSGLGYMPPEYMAGMAEQDRGVGCAALLGGNGRDVAPRKQHVICENNVFIDCVESSIEGPAWNPCIGNSCFGQGALQDEENCRLMEEKYQLDYKLQVRYNPSVNFIYRYTEEGDYDPEDPMVFSDNVMGKSYVDRDGFIAFPGTYDSPVIFTNNTMVVEGKTKLCTHILFANFNNGLRFENNHGIYPYFNQCSVTGDFIIDEMLSQWACDFSKAKLITNRSRERFPEARFSVYDPAQAKLENDQASIKDGHVILKSHDLEVSSDDTKVDPVYDISTDPHYDAEKEAVIFDGTFGIDTGIQLFATKQDFTVILSFQMDNYHDDGLLNFSFIPVLSSMNYTDDYNESPGFDVGLSLEEGESDSAKPVGGFITIRNCWKFSQCPSIDMDNYSSYPDKVYNLLIMRKNGVLKFYDFYMQKYGEVTGNDATAIFNGTLRIGETMMKPTNSEAYKLRGKVYQCKVYNKALPTKLLEEMFPNIYSNESRTKGSVTCYVDNRQYKVRIVRCTYLEVTIDLGKHAWPEYAGKYPKAVGIKVTGLYGFDEVIWVGTGTDGHVSKWIYKSGELKPHEAITVTIANTGTCPDLEAKLVAFRCVNLTEDFECVPATGIGMNWSGPLTITVGSELKGDIVLTPAGANMRKEFKMEFTGDSITASTSGMALIVRGKSPGSSTITVTHISGAVYTCTINVT